MANPIATPGFQSEHADFNPVDISADITRLPGGISVSAKIAQMLAALYAIRTDIYTLDGNVNILAGLIGDPIIASEVVNSNEVRGGLPLQFTRRLSGLVTVNPFDFDDTERSPTPDMFTWNVPSVFLPGSTDGIFNAVILHGTNNTANVPMRFVIPTVGGPSPINTSPLHPLDNAFIFGLTLVRGIMLSWAYNAD